MSHATIPASRGACLVHAAADGMNNNMPSLIAKTYMLRATWSLALRAHPRHYLCAVNQRPCYTLQLQ